MPSNVFVSYANPTEKDSAERVLFDDFFYILGSRLANLNGTEKRREIVFRDCESIPPSTPNYDELLREQLNNCAIGVILLSPRYLSPKKPYCYWEFQQLHRRAVALAGAGGMMFGMYYNTINFHDGYLAGLKAFTAAVMGGIGNIPGAMLGGVLLGVFEGLAAGYISSQWKNVFAFLILILILLFRPTGLLGARVVKKV